MKTFKQFITEAKPPKPDAAETIARNQERKRPGTVFKVTTTKKGVVVNNLYNSPDQRNQGVATQMMNTLHNYTDKQKIPTSLSQSSEPGKERDLRRFYRRLGYKQLPDSDRYVRQPQ
jgi:GNAT superfamily N-acetyltransferase